MRIGPYLILPMALGLVLGCDSRPSDTRPPVAPPPSLLGRRPVFASLNKTVKMGDRVFAVWCRLLHRVPDARLMLISPGGDTAPIQARWRERFTEAGIDFGRIDLLPTCTLPQFLDLFAQVDVALDPFPYCGGTTTLLTVWMGVPLITLRGLSDAGDTGNLLLDGIGMGELVADSEDDYVERAARLIRSPERLARLRAALRPMLMVSPLMTEGGTSRELQAVFRKVWTDYLSASD